jgi:hypothetical protein
MADGETVKPNQQTGLMRLWSLLRHPVTGYVVAIAIAVLSYSKTERVPVYAVSNTELLAGSGDLSSNLALYWQGKQVQRNAVEKHTILKSFKAVP